MFSSPESQPKLVPEDVCRVCGYRAPGAWQDGVPGHQICDCCGRESGYEDTTVEAVLNYRHRWFFGGSKWFNTKATPGGWNLYEQLQRVPQQWRPSTLIGSKESFAVEFRVDNINTKEPNNIWVFGNFRVWVTGQSVGDWTDSTTLHQCASWFKKLVSDLESDPSAYQSELLPELEGLDADYLFKNLFDEIHNGGAETVRSSESLIPATVDQNSIHALYGQLNISHLGMSAWVDSYNVWGLRETTDSFRFLWCGYASDDAPHSGVVSVAEIKTVVTRFQQAVESYQRLGT